MGEIIYDKLVYGRELTPEQWSKLKYRPLDDTDMYGIAENPSFGIDKSLIGGGNYMEIFFHVEEYGNVNVLCALFNIEAEHEEHQYPERKQVYENTNGDTEPYLFVGPNYNGQYGEPTATLSENDWNALISGRDFTLDISVIGEESTEMFIYDGSKSYNAGVRHPETGVHGYNIDSSNQELISALNTNGLYISGNNLMLNSLSVESFDTADFTKISLSKTAPSIYEEHLPTNYYLYIKEPFSIDNGENDYTIYYDTGEGYLIENGFGKFYTSPQTYSTPNVEVSPNCIGMGTVSVSPQKSSYEALSEITMTANANEGYMFSKWNSAGGTVSGGDTHTDRVGPNYYAVFGRHVVITVEAEPVEGGTVSGGGTYASGSNVTLTATPNEGYVFDGWWEGETQRTGENESKWYIKVGSEDTTYTAKFSNPEDRRLTYTTNSDAGEIQWIAENCIDGTYSHDENGGEAILRSVVDTISEFDDNDKLTGINIPNSVTSIGQDAFRNCSKLTSIEIPNSVTSIENHAFNGCYSLTSIDLPSGLTEIKFNTFDGCTSLTSIDIPSSLTSIESYAFYGCSNLASIDLPSELTVIEYNAFTDCTSLASIELPSSVTSIGQSAFGNCTSLANVYCYIETIDTISSIGAIAYSIFNNIAENPTLHVPSSVLSEYQKQEYTYYNVFGENIIAITE